VKSFWADRLDHLPAYLFVEIDRKKREAIAAGRDVIDFGVGDPDLPTHPFIVDAMAEAIRKPPHHRYASGAGSPEYRKTIAAFFSRRFGVTLDPNTEVLALLGSKEGLAHLPTGLLNPGQTALIPDPGYPVYIAGTLFAGGKCYKMALREETGWLPDLDAIPASVLDNARLLFLNYPNNPTAACAPLSFFEKAVAFARKHELLIVQDAAYSEMGFKPDAPPPSILQVPGAKDVSIELHSLSKTFNMTGWRAAFAVGNAKAIAALAKVKNNVDSGIFGAVQEAAIAALNGIDRPEIRDQIATYRRRRDILISGLREAGWSVATPQATFYVWTKPPPFIRGDQGGSYSMAVASRILAEADVVVIPGIGFGQCGEGYVRFALTVPESRTAEAVKRIGGLTW
jgi:LL-diaminopimelate aminotransferase